MHLHSFVYAFERAEAATAVANREINNKKDFCLVIIRALLEFNEMLSQ